MDPYSVACCVYEYNGIAVELSFGRRINYANKSSGYCFFSQSWTCLDVLRNLRTKQLCHMLEFFSNNNNASLFRELFLNKRPKEKKIRVYMCLNSWYKIFQGCDIWRKKINIVKCYVKVRGKAVLEPFQLRNGKSRG